MLMPFIWTKPVPDIGVGNTTTSMVHRRLRHGAVGTPSLGQTALHGNLSELKLQSSMTIADPVPSF